MPLPPVEVAVADSLDVGVEPDALERTREPALEGPDSVAGVEVPFVAPEEVPSEAVVPPGASWAERTLAEMSLPEKVGQMMMPIVLGDFTPEGSAAHDRIVELIRHRDIGGVVVSVGSPADVAVKLNDLQRHAHRPLLVAADLETGAGFRLSGGVHSPTNIPLGGATDFPSLMALGATDRADLAYEMGRITAVEARAVGIHVPFAPVLDVNSNPENPVINVRSLGEDPQRVAELGTALVLGMQDHGTIATGKHFPGHGDAEADSHRELPVISASRARLDSVELVPFRRAIRSGMGGVMTAHIAVPTLSGGTQDPATLAADVLTGLLREEMGFEGLLFTDAMNMGAIDRRFRRGEAAVRAVEAGADVVLMPPDVGAAVDALVMAVSDGRISEERIDQSARRILAAKERLRLHEKRTVPVDDIYLNVGIPEHVAVAEEIARRSLTLLRNEGDLLPLLGTRSARVLSVTHRRQTDILAGRYFEARPQGRISATHGRHHAPGHRARCLGGIVAPGAVLRPRGGIALRHGRLVLGLDRARLRLHPGPLRCRRATCRDLVRQSLSPEGVPRRAGIPLGVERVRRQPAASRPRTLRKLPDQRTHADPHPPLLRNRRRHPAPGRPP